jgi:Tol biopolymer transport system component/DNA-binding winged helix-turn-helix (wHTH) protein
VTGNKSIVFKFADVEVREREFCLVKAGEVLPVEPKTFRVLLFLLRNPQKLISKEELLNAVWGDIVVTDSSLTRTIAQLRRLLGDETRNPRYIETVATVGYRFLSKVEISEDASGMLDTTGKANGLSQGDFVEALANGEIAEAAANPPAQIDTAASNKGKSGKQIDGRRNRLWKWVLPGAALLAVGLAVAVWFLHRPLPPLHVAEFTQITHDGQAKYLRGTDGSRLYFNKLQIEQIVQVDTKGGGIAPAPVEIELPWLEDVSPDGATFLVASDINAGSTWTVHPLWSVRILGGSRRYLADAIASTWSPDGDFVAYSTGEGDIFLIRSNGTGSHKLASVGGKVDFLHWSPDGGTIRFSKDDRIWEISSNGSNFHQLLPGWQSSSVQCCGRWAPDGRFFFVSDGQIYVLDEQRRLFRQPPALPVQLTSGPTQWDMPIPGRDGKKIFASGVTPRGELVRFDIESKAFQPFLGGISAEFVTFSKDGKSVAYVSYPESVLWKADRDGSRPVQLTDPPMEPRSPNWSPDGTQIIFVAQPHKGDQVEAYIVSSQGGSPRRILPEDSGAETDPNYSPDGRKIAFSTSQENGRDPESVVRILDRASHQVTTLPGSVGVFAPHWSPDGRKIFGVSFERLNLKVFDIASQRWSVLHTGPAGFPEWSRDSQFIYFINWQTDPGIFRIRITGGVPERMFDLKEFHSTGSYNLWLGLDPTDAPLMMRDIGNNDIYALTLERK